jgi:two-component sensor histidine kinase
MKPDLVAPFLLFFLLVVSLKGSAGIQRTNEIPTVLIAQEQLNEDSPLFYYHNKSIFKNPKIKQDDFDAKGIYWLRIHIPASKDYKKKTYVLSFNNLTYVDLTLIDDRSSVAIDSRKAGLFRPLKEITPGDDRNHFTLEIDVTKTYTCLLKIHHIKGYSPQLDFYIEDQLSYLKREQKESNIYAFLEGAIIVLLLYIALAWIVSRYRPYIWIFTFLMAVGMYSFALQKDFIDLFFAENPRLGWTIGPLFYRLGTISFYLLLQDFLNLKKLSPLFYKLALIICLLVVSFAVFSFIYSYTTSNYYLSNRINFILGAIHIVYLSTLFIYLWKKVDEPQRFLAYGTTCFSLGIGLIVILLVTMDEKSLLYIPAVIQLFVLSITIIFLIAIRLRIRKQELEYHKSIEIRVEERTAELHMANTALNKQQSELLEKNTYIETLIDELNHRVKNNLQLLYSLGSLYQKGDKNSVTSNPAIQEMQSRIHTMMLVNQLLVHNKGNKLKLDQLVMETISYLQMLYDPKQRIAIDLYCVLDYWIPTHISTSLGLIITELLTNAYKYAFPTEREESPTIMLEITQSTDKLSILFWDNGVGSDTLVADSSLGIALIRDLARQIKGEISIDPKNGYHYHFEFKKGLWK